MTKTTKENLIKEVFETVYMWGTYGVKADYNNVVYRSLLGKLMGNKLNGVHKRTYLSCYIQDCKLKHLAF